MEEVTSNLSTVFEDVSSWELPSGIQLADPSFYIPGEVDILLGAKHFWSAMKNGKRKLGVGFPELRETNFGWVIVGARSKVFPAVQTLSCNVLFLDGPSSAVQQIKEVDQVSGGPFLPTEEESSEEFNQRSPELDATGGHGVGLPFKGVVELGESQFLLETEEFGHCELVDKNKDKPGTKVRVVFGAFTESSYRAALTSARIKNNIRRKDSRVVSDHLTAGGFRQPETIGNDINREDRGGRKQISSLEFDKKHPVVLPHKHYNVTSPSRALDAGPSGLLAAARQRFWRSSINRGSTIREVAHKSGHAYVPSRVKTNQSRFIATPAAEESTAESLAISGVVGPPRTSPSTRIERSGRPLAGDRLKPGSSLGSHNLTRERTTQSE